MQLNRSAATSGSDAARREKSFKSSSLLNNPLLLVANGKLAKKLT
jgi:hypothetical protein